MPDNKVPLPDFTRWPSFPFEGDMRVKRLAAPVEVEPPRSGEDAADCVACGTPDDAYIWVSERWRVRAMDRPTGLPMVLILECRSHLDLGDLPNLLAAELGVMTVRLERAVRSLDGVARVHVNRWGDGSAHLHLWFLARPYGRLQLRGTFLSLWDDILPVIPEQQWRENLALVAAWLAEFGGTAIAEPPHIQWQAPSTFSYSPDAGADAGPDASTDQGTVFDGDPTAEDGFARTAGVGGSSEAGSGSGAGSASGAGAGTVSGLGVASVNGASAVGGVVAGAAGGDGAAGGLTGGSTGGAREAGGLRAGPVDGATQAGGPGAGSADGANGNDGLSAGPISGASAVGGLGGADGADAASGLSVDPISGAGAAGGADAASGLNVGAVSGAGGLGGAGGADAAAGLNVGAVSGAGAVGGLGGVDGADAAGGFSVDPISGAGAVGGLDAGEAGRLRAAAPRDADDSSRTSHEARRIGDGHSPGHADDRRPSSLGDIEAVKP